jgi:hypothetical protein
LRCWIQIADVAAHVSLPVAQIGKAALNLFQDFQNGVFGVHTLAHAHDRNEKRLKRQKH